MTTAMMHRRRVLVVSTSDEISADAVAGIHGENPFTLGAILHRFGGEVARPTAPGDPQLLSDSSCTDQQCGEDVSKTGVEMETLTAVSVAALTIFDIINKAVDSQEIICDIKVTEKSGDRSDDWKRVA